VFLREGVRTIPKFSLIIALDEREVAALPRYI
jgi:hypothetical protein